MIRRKVRTEFSLSDKLLAEPTTAEEKRLADLELQFEIQNKIVEASKKLMNERNIKQRVKKQRKVNYDDAVSKLQRLDTDLNQLKRQLQEEHRAQLENKNRIKKQVIEKHMSPPAPTSLRTKNGFLRSDLVPIPLLADTKHAGSSRLSRKRRGKITSSSSDNDCHSVPASPVITREFKINPISPVSDDSPVVQPPVAAKVVPPSGPVSILKKSRPVPETVVYDEPDSFPHHISVPEELMRSNSLENVRRKSYISAVSSPPTPAYRNINYYTHHPLGNRAVPRNPPPPIPNAMAKRPLPPTPVQSVCSFSEPSVPDAIVEECDHTQSSHCYDRINRPTDERQSPRVQDRMEDVDISSKAVRSSVIRTPAITITTTSSSDAQMSQNNHNNQNHSSAAITERPSPVPSPLTITKSHRFRAYSGPAAPEKNTTDQLEPLICPSPTPSSASSLLSRQLMQQEQERMQSMPPPNNLPPRKPKKSMNKFIPPPLPLLQHNVSVSRSCTPEVRSITPAIENDVFEQELVPPASPFISMTRAYVETPRPDPIPMSPQVNSQTGVVVEVGTCRPSYEETKPFEFSDALKYSAKHRRRQETGAKSETSVAAEPASKEPVASVSNLMNESFIATAVVSNDFHNEMVDWYDENLKKATVV